MSQNIEIQDTSRIDALFERISALIEQARQRVATTINIAEVYTKYSIGQYIVEDEQQGEQRAQYGKAVLKNLSARLTNKYGEGWSVETLTLCRKFYSMYSNLVNSVYQILIPKNPKMKVRSKAWHRPRKGFLKCKKIT